MELHDTGYWEGNTAGQARTLKSPPLITSSEICPTTPETPTSTIHCKAIQFATPEEDELGL